MLPPGLSPEEAAALQQAPRITEAPLNKDPLSALSCSSGLPHVKSSRSSTLSSAEENVFTVSAAAALPPPPPPGPSHRFLGEREFGQTLHGINGEPLDSTSYPVLEDKAQQQQQDGAAASPSVSGDPGDRYAPDALPPSSVVAPEAHSISPPLVATFGSSATRDRFSGCTREPGGAALQGYRTELFSPPVQRNPASVDSAGERKSDISPRGGDRGTTGGPAATAALFTSTPASASADSLPQPAAAADPKRAPLAAAQPRAAADVVGEEVHRSASAGKTETYSRNERTEELQQAAAIAPASVSPRKQKGGGPQGERSVKEENAMEVITRLDVAVEALVAHAEEQAEQIKKLTMLVEDLSVKLEGLQEGLLSGRVSVHLAPPAPAELPPAAGATEVRQSRGRMVPPPLPRDKVREPRLGAADQQGLPPHSRQGSNAACERSTISANYLAAQREADIEALERRRIEEQREAQRREGERLRREEEERRRREELTRRAAEEQRRREALDEKRKNIISSLISNKGGSSLFGDDGGAASHRSLFDD